MNKSVSEVGDWAGGTSAFSLRYVNYSTGATFNSVTVFANSADGQIIKPYIYGSLKFYNTVGDYNSDTNAIYWDGN